MREPVHFLMEATSVLWFLVLRSHGILDLFKVEPVESTWVALKAARNQVLERAGSIPGPLVVAVEGFSFGVEPNAARGADATGGWRHLPVLAHSYAPPPVGNLTAKGTGQAKNDPHVSFRVEF